MKLSRIEGDKMEGDDLILSDGVTKDQSLLGMASNIVASYVQSNNMGRDDVISMIDDVYAKLSEIDADQNGQYSSRQPAVPIEESITDDFIICLEDGKPFKMLKKHLKAVYNLTPEEYRAKWRLPVDYPMVAPNYAVKRQELARQSGLGRKKS